MQTKLNPYISFKDNAREAMEFYKSVFGGNLDLRTFKDYGAPHGPGQEDMIMHSALEANAITLMAADTPDGMEYEKPAGISMSLSGDNEAEMTGYFEKLCDGGTVLQPLTKAQWGDTFGMCVDKFGILWFVNISAAQAA